MTHRYKDEYLCGDVAKSAHTDGRHFDAVVSGRQIPQHVAVSGALVAVGARATVEARVWRLRQGKRVRLPH